MKKFFEKGKKLYWWLIATFAVLYLAVAFVSTLHAITFFQLANTLGLAILLGAAYEIGQAAVLFSILMSQNRNRILAWGMMFLLTALQVTANVYASFKFMDGSGSEDWRFWQRAILFGVQAENDEMYKVIISWISGALLPVVALGMTALVADNIRMAQGDIKPEEKKEEEDEDEGRLWGRKKKEEKKEEVEESEDLLEFVDEKPETPITIENAKLLEEDSIVKDQLPSEGEAIEISPPQISQSYPSMEEATKNLEKSLISQEPEETIYEAPVPLEDIKPTNTQRGWHFNKEYVDEDHNVFEFGKFIGNDPSKEPTPPKSKKA